MNVILVGHDFSYEINELLKLFLKPSEIHFVDERALVDNQSSLLISSSIKIDDVYVIHAVIQTGQTVSFQKEIEIQCSGKSDHELRKEQKRIIKRCVFDVLRKYTMKRPKWGILTGIRPSKIVHEYLDSGYGLAAIKGKLREEYEIEDEKIELVTKIAEIERPFLYPIRQDHVSVYISIPFCPTRCVYCSFPSYPMEKWKGSMNPYLEALCYEIKETGKLLKAFDKKVDTLYIGGGTPTTLSANDFHVLFSVLYGSMDLSEVKEFTVEAGRPDTIEKEKLMVLKNHGVNRISINPQTMNAATLKTIGRDHNPEDILKAFYLAKDIDFHTVNMDLIVGLPGETPEMMKNTMEAIKDLDPENITVHTLAVKKSSALKENLEEFELAQENQAIEMLQIADQYALSMGMTPYYMYRQKYMVGNLENIGYCKKGHECIYNIQIMEERQSIIALGAGAISKIIYPEENRLERVPNVVSLEHYINRIDEMIVRKRIELQKSR